MSVLAICNMFWIVYGVILAAVAANAVPVESPRAVHPDVGLTPVSISLPKLFKNYF